MSSAGDIFFDHLLKKEHVPLVKISSEQHWPSFLLVTCLLLLVFVKRNALPKVLRIIQSTFSPQILQQLEREEKNPFKFYTLALNLFFLLNVSFLAYKINAAYRLVLVDSSQFAQFFFCLSMVFLLYALKFIANQILIFFTGSEGVITEYSISATLVNQTFGLFIFPFIVLIEFSNLYPPAFIFGAIAVLAFSMLLKWYRGIKMGLVEERIGILQIFSYFCGLEILPALVMVKYIVETF